MEKYADERNLCVYWGVCPYHGECVCALFDHRKRDPKVVKSMEKEYDEILKELVMER